MLALPSRLAETRTPEPLPIPAIGIPTALEPSVGNSQPG